MYCAVGNALDDPHYRSTAQHLVQSQEVVRSDHAVGDLTEDEDDVYFGSYGHFSIHQEMLKVGEKFPSLVS